MNDVQKRLFSRGYETGNYANAYENKNIEIAWDGIVRAEDVISRNVAGSDAEAYPYNTEEYRAAFILGFWSSYEQDEIPGYYWRETHAEIWRRWHVQARELGIAVRESLESVADA